MKACPNAAILQTFNRAGLSFDASSGYEVSRAQRAGIAAEKISLSSQEFPSNFQELMATGIEFNACSLHQLEQFGKHFPGGRFAAYKCLIHSVVYTVSLSYLAKFLFPSSLCKITLLLLLMQLCC